MGVAHVIVTTDEMALPEYRRNAADRCYFCKSVLLDRLVEQARQRELPYVVTGTNSDDVASDVRPGITAGVERGVRTPLHDVGMGKADVRRLADAWGLALWDKPASPCLASRIKHGVPVTIGRLARIERAEVAVRNLLSNSALTVRDLRVRDLGTDLRVEVDGNQVDDVAGLGPQLALTLVGAGFPVHKPVSVTGFRSGSLSQPSEELN